MGWREMELTPEQKNDFKLSILKQNNQATLDYGLKALQALFLLNGAAATAILASGETVLYHTVLCFGLGALVAIVALGLSYVINLLITEHIAGCVDNPAGEGNPTYCLFFSSQTDDIERLRAWIIKCFLGSAALFAIGLLWAWCLL